LKILHTSETLQGVTLLPTTVATPLSLLLKERCTELVAPAPVVSALLEQRRIRLVLDVLPCLRSKRPLLLVVVPLMKVRTNVSVLLLLYVCLIFFYSLVLFVS
jgi:hypothetical protein